MKRILTAALLIAAVLIAGCGKKTTVTRMDSGTTIDLSGHWNDTDSRLTAEALIAQITTGGWLGDHLQRTGHKPALIVGRIRNRSDEHIPVKTFVADLERATGLSEEKIRAVLQRLARLGRLEQNRQARGVFYGIRSGA